MYHEQSKAKSEKYLETVMYKANKPKSTNFINTFSVNKFTVFPFFFF